MLKTPSLNGIRVEIFVFLGAGGPGFTWMSPAKSSSSANNTLDRDPTDVGLNGIDPGGRVHVRTKVIHEMLDKT